MSATTQNLRQRHGMAAYRHAQAESIRTGERLSARKREHERRAAAIAPLVVVQATATSRIDRAIAGLWRMHDGARRVWILLAVLIGAVDAALLALYAGWWTP